MHKMMYRIWKNKHIMYEKFVQNNLCDTKTYKMQKKEYIVRKKLVQNNLCDNETIKIRTEEQQKNEKFIWNNLYAEEIGNNDAQQKAYLWKWRTAKGQSIY